MELGHHQGTKKPVQARDMLAYKMACAAVAAGLNFDWQGVTLTLD
jgi:hypothetical protein